MRFIEKNDPHYELQLKQTFNRIGVGMRNLRTARDIDQIELSSLIGVTRETINKIEGCKQKPSVEILVKIAYSFNMSLKEFFDHCGKLEI